MLEDNVWWEAHLARKGIPRVLMAAWLSTRSNGALVCTDPIRSRQQVVELNQSYIYIYINVHLSLMFFASLSPKSNPSEANQMEAKTIADTWRAKSQMLRSSYLAFDIP